MAKRRNNAQRLRNAVNALPRHTQEAMLTAIGRNRIIVGAYTDKKGGVCPMLGAHRNGGRTNFGTFARAWDGYTQAKKARRASAREVNTLRSFLEDALLEPHVPDMSLTDAVSEVQASRRRSFEIEAREGEDITIEQLLSETYADAEQRRTERRAADVLADEPDHAEEAEDAESGEPHRFDPSLL